MSDDASSDDEHRAAFDALDRDGDGLITIIELFRVLRREGFPVTAEQARAVHAAADANGDRRIDYDEYLRFVR